MIIYLGNVYTLVLYDGELRFCEMLETYEFADFGAKLVNRVTDSLLKEKFQFEIKEIIDQWIKEQYRNEKA